MLQTAAKGGIMVRGYTFRQLEERELLFNGTCLHKIMAKGSLLKPNCLKHF